MKFLYCKAMVVSLICLLVLSLASCATEETADPAEEAEETEVVEEIVIGTTGPLSGDTARWGQAEMYGAQVAVNNLNDAGGVLGRPLRLVAYDDRADEVEAMSTARRLITEDGAVAIIGHGFSSICIALAPLGEQYQVPFVASFASALEVTVPEPGKVRPYYFRTGFITAVEGGSLAQFVVDEGFERAAVIYDIGQDYSTALRTEFRNSFTALGGSVVVEESITTGEEEFRAVATGLLEHDFDVLVMTTFYKEAALFIRQARGIGIDQQVVGTYSLEVPELIELGGDTVEGVYVISPFSLDDPSPKVQDYQKKFYEIAGFEPDGNSAGAYDAVLLIADAIERAGSLDGEAIRDAMAATEGLEAVHGVKTLLGPITIDPEFHGREVKAMIVQVQDAKFRFVRNIE